MPTIKELRAEKKLSQSEFAKSIDIGLSTVANYEKGRIKPSEKVVEKIKAVYGVDVSEAAPAAEAAPAKKAAEKKAAPAKKAAEKKAEKKAEPAKKVAEKKVEKKAEPAKKVAEKKAAPAKKTAEKKAPAKKAAPAVIIQSPLGGEITPEDILSRIGDADKIYIRVDENKAYWVRGEEFGSVDLW